MNQIVADFVHIARAHRNASIAVAKNLADAYNPKRTRWHKILNRGYSQRQGAPNGSASGADTRHNSIEACSRQAEAEGAGVMGFGEAIRKCFSKYATFSGPCTALGILVFLAAPHCRGMLGMK